MMRFARVLLLCYIVGREVSSLRTTCRRSPLAAKPLAGPLRNNLHRLKATIEDEARTKETDEPRNEDLTARQKKMKRKGGFFRRTSKLPRKAVRVYTDYAQRLWAETDPAVRRSISRDKATAAIRKVETIARGSNTMPFSDTEELKEARGEMLRACQKMLREMAKASAASDAVSNEVAISEASPPSKKKKKKKPRRSILFGAVMGMAVAAWVFSGNWIFTGLFTLMTVLGQLEYYRMVMKTGVYPARRISVIGASSMFLTALFAPNLHQICLPMFGLWAMIWFLTMRRQITRISEIAATFTGMFYLGYVPSFWVRIRLIGAGREPTRLAPFVRPMLEMMGRRAESLPNFIPRAIHFPITTGAIFIFWAWISLAFNDVGAYFVGKNFGKTKLGKLAPGAGAASPNKTVEGLFGGLAFSVAFSVAGAWVQKWPSFVLTGAVHGICLGLLGLIGDLTASMLKRDADIKDFGDLIPEHGGILDRVDGFIWTAPYSWLVCSYIIPALKARARVGLV
mmetsp:Transcript_20998/g.31117  ORF Transcript_20998/g.31117 Transcript_20998/m.31117 type:complete len:511 (-) Transcript_20998:254-1786(-)|eukprot:CAMPEP_0194038388 /NCGR_PEP_ID=MMETSP0009_2-20130614/10628_1 /TAXON_ID=210454 /ORGANISM="Grammatophora oceanica, Strain CCMP 410" /LENGTH=510 /DNA_ID=CAMNT_0038680871 /DNA_START=80 /DNA_END=1612 /DNA_ORIENTATION=-